MYVKQSGGFTSDSEQFNRWLDRRLTEMVR